MTIRIFALAALILLLSGCWNGGNHHINMGNVSVGQQLIDLQKAFELGAINQTEYDQTRATLLSINTVCESVPEEE